ncbi:MAG: dATP/dGTP diphosphohydrolase domain-containing protein [Pirellulales bacterium]
MTDNTNPKDLAGRAKPQMGYFPVGAMEPLARVMELGAKKYGPYNWRQQPIRNMDYAHAALRHLTAWIGGQSIDPESGISHLAHVASRMAIVLDAESVGTAIEDRSWMAAGGVLEAPGAELVATSQPVPAQPQRTGRRIAAVAARRAELGLGGGTVRATGLPGDGLADERETFAIGVPEVYDAARAAKAKDANLDVIIADGTGGRTMEFARKPKPKPKDGPLPASPDDDF